MPTTNYTAGRPELGLTDAGELTLDYPDGRLVVLSLEPNGQVTTYTLIGRAAAPDRVPAMLVSTAKYHELKAELERRAEWVAQADAKRVDLENKLEELEREKNEDANERARDLADELDRTQAKYLELEDKYEDACDEARELRRKVDGLEDDVDRLKGVTRERALFAGELHDRNRALEAKLNHQSRELEELKMAHEGEASAADRLKAERDAARDGLKTIGRENTRLRAALLRARTPGQYDHDGVDHGGPLKAGTTPVKPSEVYRGRTGNFYFDRPKYVDYPTGRLVVRHDPSDHYSI